MTASQSASRKLKQLDAGCFQPEISSFRLHLAAEGKAEKTVRTYTEAVQWFAGEHLRRETVLTGWEEVGKQDIQRWVVRLLGQYSSAYASNQYRALQQFFKWLAAEDEIPDPMAGLKPPHVPDKPVPIFHDQDLASIERTCAGRTFARRRDAAVIAVPGPPGSGPGRSPGSATARTTPGAATLTCRTARSGYAARAAGNGSSRSGTTPPAPWTATSASAPGTRRHGGRSCGWASITAGP